MKTIQLILIAGLLLPFAACSKKATDAANAAGGEGERDYKEMARNFVRNPEGLRNLVEENEDNQRRIRDMEGRLSTSRQTETNATNDLRQAQTQIADLQAQLASAESRASAAEAAASQQQQNEIMTDQQVVAGIIFQVQLGAFAQPDNQVESDLATGDGLELQDQNGLQKVVVSQFRSYASARQLRDRLRQMGVRDAFVVAKQDGVRITVPEALELTGQN